jgi:hypothetical protein
MSDILSITYDGAAAVSPSDTVNDPAGPYAAFHTGSGGTIRVLTIAAEDTTLVSIPAGVIYPLAIKRVFSSTTTATGIVGLRAQPFRKKVSS